MSLQEQMAADVQRTFLDTNGFAEAIGYTSAGESAQSISAIVLRDQAEIEPSENGLEIRRRVEIIVSTSDVASPARGDTASFPVQSGGSAVSWNVTDDPLVSGGMARIACYRREMIEKSARGHRLET